MLDDLAALLELQNNTQRLGTQPEEGSGILGLLLAILAALLACCLLLLFWLYRRRQEDKDGKQSDRRSSMRLAEDSGVDITCSRTSHVGALRGAAPCVTTLAVSSGGGIADELGGPAPVRSGVAAHLGSGKGGSGKSVPYGQNYARPPISRAGSDGTSRHGLLSHTSSKALSGSQRARVGDGGTSGMISSQI